MILHTLSAAPGSSAYNDCIRLLCNGDALLLLGDGVYCALAKKPACQELIASTATLYALENDVTAAGILDRLDSKVSVVNFDEFAALTEQHLKQQAWY